MPRTISLGVFDNGAKPAHSAIFIPTDGQGLKGKIIHVTGNPATGFFLEFKRNYDFLAELRTYEIIPLAQVNDRYVRDTVGSGQESIDTIARDRLESVATVVPAPGRSVNPFDPSAPNCQNWIQDYIQKLISEGLIAGDASLVLQAAPRVLRK
ncbi:hypothetical protein BO78DRAFT_395008 [Aspergillus sclerotiicarbonarius CBS 121057]|uniref:Uncharacterized protein n=1 Tax=Aspergillus sclerotiicarbonarius (strain CBS 121057 / IBT 28362) TaxID=1448318 RepID=A0A319FL84_ASPSB|nr:hypothetical protein BO78DRAFT_395008 [Aspergillus sclerotiicarbonarius CBS 121057]